MIRRSRAELGSSMVEATLMVPWIIFLFVGLLDVGFFCYAAIATQNAARVAVLRTSSSASAAANATFACKLAVNEMQGLPNVNPAMTCGAGAPTSSMPISIKAQLIDRGSGDVASRVTVSYLTIPMIPIPGILKNQFTFTRTAELRVAN